MSAEKGKMAETFQSDRVKLKTELEAKINSLEERLNKTTEDNSQLNEQLKRAEVYFLKWKNRSFSVHLFFFYLSQFKKKLLSSQTFKNLT